MMRNLCMMLVLFFAFAKAYSQPKFNTTVNDQQPEVKVVIKDFFAAFHKKDTSLMRSMFIKDPAILSIMAKKDKQTVTKTDLTSLLESLAKIPDNVAFNEELIAINEISEPFISTVSTPYVFTINGQVSHRGTNVFTLFKIDGRWKIASISDSRIYN